MGKLVKVKAGFDQYLNSIPSKNVMELHFLFNKPLELNTP